MDDFFPTVVLICVVVLAAFGLVELVLGERHILRQCKEKGYYVVDQTVIKCSIDEPLKEKT